MIPLRKLSRFFGISGRKPTPTRREVCGGCHAAISAGITLFDTAEVYGLGKSEELLGQFARETTVPIIIATKFAPLPWRFQQQAVADALTASLKRLNVARVDLYQVHWPFELFLTPEILMDALADEYEQGRIGAVGVSNYDANQLRTAHRLLAARGVPLAVNQVRYSLLTREIETNGVLVAARELGVTILAYSPLAQGLLTGRYTPNNPPTGARSWDRRFSAEGLAKIAPTIDLLTSIGRELDKTPAQVALNCQNSRSGGAKCWCIRLAVIRRSCETIVAGCRSIVTDRRSIEANLDHQLIMEFTHILHQSKDTIA
jgi:aryl-alcohol dehydrogenase-like predicted oxidoreductase